MLVMPVTLIGSYLALQVPARIRKYGREVRRI
jgi:hypothetical protein